MEWVIVRGNRGMLGYIPSFLSLLNPESARNQLNHNYCAGWNPFPGFNLNSEAAITMWRLKYPGDPPMLLIAYTKLRTETIALFESEWVAIVQENGEYEVSRMD